MASVIGIARGEARAIWPACVDILSGEISKSGETPESMLTLIEAGKAQLWTLQDDGKIIAAGITQVTQEAGGKICHAIGLAGRAVIENRTNIMALVMGWARENGCASIRFEGRDGWLRVFKPLGFSKKAIILEKAL